MRGLRVEDIAREAGVSLGLIYYHFGDRSGLLSATFAFVGERAGAYTEEARRAGRDARDQLERLLLSELQDDPLVVETSSAWGEFRASAVFEPELREALRSSTVRWNRDVTEVIELAQQRGLAHPGVDPAAAGERLTALVEGLSERWLGGALELERARELLQTAVAKELDAPGRTAESVA